jgi:hypothetical protein
MKAELLKLVVQIITLLIAGYIAPAIMSWLTERVEDTRMARIKDWALKAVKAAEQLYKDYEDSDPNGSKRRKIAITTLEGINARCKLGLSEEEIMVLVEAAVHEINHADISYCGILPEMEASEEDE